MPPEGDFLAYLLEVSEDADASYALGRIREAVAFRVKRLPAGDERAFQMSLLALCQDAGGGVARSPAAIKLAGGAVSSSAIHIASVVGKIRHRRFAALRAA